MLALSFAVLSVLSAGTRTAFADSFMNPARSSYSLEKTADRPYLQSVPVPQVWQTDSSSAAFKKALLDATLPETAEERHFNALVWQSDEYEDQNDIQTIFFDEKLMDYYIASGMVDAFVPISSLAEESALSDINMIDARARRYVLKKMDSDSKKLTENLTDIQAFLDMAVKTAPWEVETEKTEALFRNKDRQEYALLAETKDSFLPDSVLDNAERFDFYEISSLNNVRMFNDMLSNLLFEELLDMSVGIGIMEDKELYPPEEVVENMSKAASLLDRTKKNNQILDNTLSAEKKALKQRIQQKFYKKDVK